MKPARHVTHIVFLFFLSLVELRAAPVDYKIRKISISGIFTRKDFYKKKYRLSKGMVFKQEEHDDSVRVLIDDLKKSGYLQASIQPSCIFDKANKTVSINLHIQRGNLFTIRSVACHSSAQSDKQPPDELLNKLQKRLESRIKNSYYSQELIEDQACMMSAYFAKKGYLFAAIEMEQTINDLQHCVDIVFKCALKHKKQLIFIGNSIFDAQQLYELCSEFGKALLIIPPEMLAQELRDFYIKHGYLDVEIICREDDSMLIFDIKEGKKAIIESIELKGLHELGECMHFFSKVIHKPYNQKKINKALQMILNECIKQGYGNCSLNETKLHKNSEGTYTLCISFTLGSRLHIHKIEADEFQELVTRMYKQSWCKEYQYFFNKQQCPDLSKIVDMHHIAHMRKFLQKQLHDEGFLYTHVVPQFLTQEEQSILRWTFEGKKEAVRFGDTRIQGSCDVPDLLIERACAYKKGDIWNKKKLNETAMVLRNFGVFDQVTVFPEDITRLEDAKTVIIQVQDSDPFELRTRVGFQGVGTNLSWRGGATYKFGGTFLWKNPRKAADIASLQLDITRFFRYATLMYQLPFLGKWPIRQQFKLYSNRYHQPVVLGSREILYHYAQDGFLWELSQDYSGTKWGIATGINWIKTSDISKKLSEAINFTTSFIDKHIAYIFTEPSFYTSDIDNRLNPLVGWYLLLSSKALLPCGVKDAAFIKFLLEQGSYIPLHKPSYTVLALRLRLGTILYQSFSAIMPPERFYLGGAYSLRGYQPDLAPPLNFYHNNNQELIVVPTGGKTMMNMNAEIRFSLYQSLGGTLFTDIGILTQRGATDIRMGDILGASGFGLRWNTPVGPLRFDIGWKWKQFPGNQQFYDQGKYAWFLTLGNAF